jgi:hypothetical protein
MTVPAVKTDIMLSCCHRDSGQQLKLKARYMDKNLVMQCRKHSLWTQSETAPVAIRLKVFVQAVNGFHQAPPRFQVVPFQRSTLSCQACCVNSPPPTMIAYWFVAT